jgi:PAS domain S-box-containing protein
VTDRKKAELELQASERKFRRIFDNSLEGIFETTGEGRILVANKAMARIFGYGSIGEFKITDFSIHFADRGDVEKIRDILAVEHEIHNREVNLRRKDGTVFHALLNATVLLDADGRVDSIEGMIADISGLVESKAAPVKTSVL